MEMDCFASPRNDEIKIRSRGALRALNFIPAPRQRGKGTARRAVGGGVGRDACLTTGAPSTMLRMVPLPRYRGGG